MFLEIVTPEKTLYSKEIKYVKVPGSDGQFGVLKDHAPIISTLEKGQIKVVEIDDTEELFDVKGGVIEILKNNIIILLKL
ncbi:MAG: ATP synthase F1 subunit epsilon [Bacteroidetes bacterium]|nr:MAG: ATP synthase F1 subunit epsilon [Bacteroidota bacterium]